MESKEKVELIKMAIKQLMEEDKYNKRGNTRKSSSDESFVAVVDEDEDEDEHRFLTKLLSQVEALRAEGKFHLPESEAGAKESFSGELEAKTDNVNNEDGSSSSGIGGEEIVKELKKVKRQNFISHCLLSAMIVLTVAWQISEVCLILKVKDGVSQPFKSIGSVISRMLKGPKSNGKNGEEQSSNLIESSHLPDLKIPELPPLVGLPGFDLSCDDDDRPTPTLFYGENYFSRKKNSENNSHN